MNEQTNGISVIACTNKEGYMDNIFSNYENQLFQDKELIIVLNNDSLVLSDWLKKAESYDHIQVYQLSEETTLGYCLNFGIEKARYSYVTKWDDDDYYGCDYLSEVFKTFETTNADIVGKRTGYLYFPETKELRLRFPGLEFKVVKRVFGATISAKKTIMQEISFLDKSLGEDRSFLKHARAKGYQIFSTSKYNYATIRHDSSKHTWKPTNKYLKRTSQHIGYYDDIKLIVNELTCDQGETNGEKGSPLFLQFSLIHFFKYLFDYF